MFPLFSLFTFHFSLLLAVATRSSASEITLPSTSAPFSPCLVRSLGVRFDSEMRAHRWAPIAIPDPPAFEPFLSGTANPVPFSILVRDFTPEPNPPLDRRKLEDGTFIDFATGPMTDGRLRASPLLLPCLPERMGRSGGMFSILHHGDALRFYGGLCRPDPAHSSLPPLEWQLLTDSRTSTRTCHFQLTAPTGPDRFVEIDFLLGDTNTPPSLVTRHSSLVTLSPDPAEPRDLTPLPNGFRVRLALTPSTGNFPRSATVAFDAVPAGGAGAEPPSLGLPPPPASPLPVPPAILSGDLAGVPVFAPCQFTASVPPSALFDHLDAHPDDPFAAAALQCPVRGPSLTPVILPAGNDASTLLVNPDPDLKTALSVGPNQALAILQSIDALPAPPPAVLFRFDALQPTDLDYSPSSLYLCDYPATWSPADNPLRPAVSLAHAAAEFTATMACLLHRRGIPVLVTCPPWAPYLSYHADATLSPKSLAPGVPPPGPLPPSPSGRGPAVGRRGSGGGAPGLQPLPEAAPPAAAPQPPPPPPTNN